MDQEDHRREVATVVVGAYVTCLNHGDIGVVTGQIGESKTHVMVCWGGRKVGAARSGYDIGHVNTQGSHVARDNIRAISMEEVALWLLSL